MSNESNPVLVSILLAARNEEANIERCLRSLEALGFSKEKIEICIGDDDSSDETASIIQKYIKDKPYFKYYKISAQTAGLKGKANVLAQLANFSTGKYLFFCDADIAVSPDWIEKMLAHFEENTGVVVGLTRMKKRSLLADFLSLEWIFTLSLMRYFSLLGIPVSGLGNNMAVTRKAYDAVGGYEGIGFSIVEDYALFMAITNKKFGFVQAYTKDVIGISEPLSSFKELVTQRKRWMQGIMQSPLVIRICLIFSALLIPGIMIIAIWDPLRSIRMVVSNYFFITGIMLLATVILRQWDLLKTVLLFWFYLIGISCLMLIVHLIPGKTVWKDRTY
ncbi:glycosyltransferase [Dyadobacter sp. CY345]|uniref:glycosyltransferase n=1 Tax=Dyadobacter sp. CY345 TaxID=2909335 RepID=UPI001F352C11|nr:glycosyltransferase [Dyadobacter sp. CY345]MCF2443616.1 glycosyltransferase [Dyadobacter sp. CY345]